MISASQLFLTLFVLSFGLPFVFDFIQPGGEPERAGTLGPRPVHNVKAVTEPPSLRSNRHLELGMVPTYPFSPQLGLCLGRDGHTALALRTPRNPDAASYGSHRLTGTPGKLLGGYARLNKRRSGTRQPASAFTHAETMIAYIRLKGSHEKTN